VDMKKRDVKKTVSRSANRFGVVLEHIDSKLDLVVEGQSALQRQITDNHQEFREFRGEVNYKFDVVFDELHLIRNDLKEKVGRDEFVALEKRVIHLEKKISHPGR